MNSWYTPTSFPQAPVTRNSYRPWYMLLRYIQYKVQNLFGMRDIQYCTVPVPVQLWYPGTSTGTLPGIMYKHLYVVSMIPLRIETFFAMYSTVDSFPKTGFWSKDMYDVGFYVHVYNSTSNTKPNCTSTRTLTSQHKVILFSIIKTIINVERYIFEFLFLKR